MATVLTDACCPGDLPSVDELVPVTVYAVLFDETASRLFVVLREVVEDLPPGPVLTLAKFLDQCAECGTHCVDEAIRCLPIEMGLRQAAGITILTQADVPARPYTHDLIVTAISALGATVTAASIHHAPGRTVDGRLWISDAKGQHMLDARPSDAIAVAMRVGAPISVEEEVMQYHAVSPRGLRGLVGATAPDDAEAIVV